MAARTFIPFRECRMLPLKGKKHYNNVPIIDNKIEHKISENVSKKLSTASVASIILSSNQEEQFLLEYELSEVREKIIETKGGGDNYLTLWKKYFSLRCEINMSKNSTTLLSSIADKSLPSNVVKLSFDDIYTDWKQIMKDSFIPMKEDTPYYKKVLYTRDVLKQVLSA